MFFFITYPGTYRILSLPFNLKKNTILFFQMIFFSIYRIFDFFKTFAFYFKGKIGKTINKKAYDKYGKEKHIEKKINPLEPGYM